MSPPIMLAGKVIDDSGIKLLSLIASGGFGAVYHAVHLDTGVEYAVKVIQKGDNPAYRRELDLHTLVSEHPNIVTVHQILESAHSVYIVLDYCDGGDLFTAVTENTVYAGKDELIRSVFLQLLDAIEYCHSMGIYHRDLKPENILCSEDATQLFLLDFGMATDATHSSKPGCGSLHYMSPECIGVDNDNTEYSPESSDIWALGIILLNLVVGRNPWNFATLSDACYKSFVKNPNFLRKNLPISASVHTIITRIFARDPKSRLPLSELREMIMEVDTFYMSLTEISMSSRHVREAAVMYGPLSRPPHLRTYFPEDLEPQLSSDGSSSSDSDSSGPITPDTKPTDPDIDVPDMPEGQGIDEIMIHPFFQVSKVLRQRSSREVSTCIVRTLTY